MEKRQQPLSTHLPVQSSELYCVICAETSTIDGNTPLTSLCTPCRSPPVIITQCLNLEPMIVLVPPFLIGCMPCPVCWTICPRTHNSLMVSTRTPNLASPSRGAHPTVRHTEETKQHSQSKELDTESELRNREAKNSTTSKQFSTGKHKSIISQPTDHP